MADDTADAESGEAGGSEESSRAVEPASSAVEDVALGDVGTEPDEDELDEDEAVEAVEAGDASATDEPAAAGRSPLQLAAILGLVAVVALAGLTGWLGYRANESHQAQQQRDLFLQVGRQGAVNLTTIDYQQAESDVQRVLDSATGAFYDDFSSRAEPFTEVVKQAQSKSTGTITEAGLESVSDNAADVLVAVKVMTANAGTPEQAPRFWRMRLTVQQVGDDAKVSKVVFVE